jgi:transposase
MSVSAIGLDVHYKFSSVTMRDKAGKVVARERLEHCDRVALRERLSRWPQGVPAVLEASFGWGWLSDEMAAVGIDVQLSNCYKVEQMRKARGGAKTNKKDADLLSLLPGEADPWWRIWLAPPEVRDQREWMRYRGDLVGMQTQTKSRIHAVFHRHGIFHDFSDLFGGKGRVFLAELCREGHHAGGQLPPGALAALRGQVRLLDQLRRQLAEITGRLRRELERDELTRRLASIAGFGRILSHVLKAEIGLIERFGGNHNRLASYSLLGPRAMDTGQQDPTKTPLGRHLGHRGNRTLKWAFIEAAHAAVRHGGRFRAMFDRVTKGGTKDRNRGYIRVARELVKVVTAVWKNGTTYQETPPARPGLPRRQASLRYAPTSRPLARQACRGLTAGEPGSGKSVKTSVSCDAFSKPTVAPSPRKQMEKFFDNTRSGTGQLYRPMVVADKA